MKTEVRDSFVIVDAIKDSSWSQRQYINFREQYGFDALDFSDLEKELEVDLRDTYLFAKKDGRLYILRGITIHRGISADDISIAAVIEEKESIPILHYPKVMREVDAWIEQNKKSFG
ncbi:MAG: hypothetical protein Q7R84_03145 [bacterium]|nr:hypothetical protein [bacterium]